MLECHWCLNMQLCWSTLQEQIGLHSEALPQPILLIDLLGRIKANISHKPLVYPKTK